MTEFAPRPSLACGVAHACLAASVSVVPGCMIPVVVEWRPAARLSVVTGVGHCLACSEIVGFDL